MDSMLSLKHYYNFLEKYYKTVDEHTSPSKVFRMNVNDSSFERRVTTIDPNIIKLFSSYNIEESTV